MGSPKAELDWHGCTMLRRVVGIVARAVDGPVVVVRAPGQTLAPLPEWIELATDAREGRGPMQGLAAGLTAVGDRAEAAFVCSTDAPLLHPAFITCVIGALSEGFDAAVPDLGGHRQPLAAAYRPSLRTLVQELVAADQLGSRSLFERCRVRYLGEAELLADPQLARVDPELSSVVSLNDRAGYERALGIAAPEVELRVDGGPPTTARAWSLGALAASAGVRLARPIGVRVNGTPLAPDPELPLVACDRVCLTTRES